MEVNLAVATMMHHFITERHSIYKKKSQGLPPPWSDDIIFQTSKFTNVRRELDTESRKYITNIARNPALTYDEKLANTILFRIWNKWESMERLGGPWSWEDLTTKDLTINAKNVVEAAPDYAWFTNAFMVSGVMTGLKTKGAYNVFKVTHYFTQLIPAIKLKTTAEGVYEQLKTVSGLGDFLSFQIFVDFTYIVAFPFGEDEFAIPGPGSRRGLDLLLSKRDLPYPQALLWVQANLPKIWQELGLKWSPDELFNDRPKNRRTMTLATWQNCFCELSKYHRIANGGRAKVKYNGGSKS